MTTNIIYTQEYVDDLLKIWMNSENEKSEKAWKKLKKDVYIES
jgi:hypothetical protein